MPFNLLLLPLLSGYFFTHRTYCTRFRAYGYSSYRLVFNSALFGLGFGIASHIATRLGLTLIRYASPKIPALEFAVGAWKAFAPWEFSSSALGSLAISYLASRWANARWDESASSEEAIYRYGDSLMKILYRAQKAGKTVMLTLSDRKVYVGYVVLDLNLQPELPYVSILPTASGHGDKDDHGLHLTVSYGDIYREIVEGLRDDAVIDDFEVLVPTSMIISARVFSLKVYREYFGAQKQDQSKTRPSKSTAGSRGKENR